MHSFVDPASQGAISIDLDGGHILEEETEVFDHEVFPGCLWSANATFVVTTRCNHVARRAVRWATHHLPNEVHLSRGNHVADTRDGIEHAAYFVVAKVLFAYFGHRNVHDASYAAM